MVFSMPVEVTRPSRTLRRFSRASVTSATVCLPVVLWAAVIRCRPLGRLGFGGGDLPLPQEGVDPGHLLAEVPEAGAVLEAPGGVLEAEVEQLGPRLAQPIDQLGVAQGPEGHDRGRHQTSSRLARVTKRALTGSFWMARSMAPRASSSLTPASSKRTRPGLTTATHRSGLPLPEPMRVSAGFSVTGLSGKMLIQTLPPRRTWRVMAIRAASIWRAVIH